MHAQNTSSWFLIHKACEELALKGKGERERIKKHKMHAQNTSSLFPNSQSQYEEGTKREWRERIGKHKMHAQNKNLWFLVFLLFWHLPHRLLYMSFQKKYLDIIMITYELSPCSIHTIPELFAHCEIHCCSSYNFINYLLQEFHFIVPDKSSIAHNKDTSMWHVYY